MMKILLNYEVRKLVIKYMSRCSNQLQVNQKESFYTIKQGLHELQKTPGSLSYKTRMVKKCSLTQRVRGYYNYPKMSRMAFKKLAESGTIPGIKRSS